jgi:hypothetical protein
VANVVTTHKAFSKDEIRDFVKKNVVFKGTQGELRVGNFVTCFKNLRSQDTLCYKTYINWA